jgi:23S rRNA pseudouridine2605 synthase
MSDGGGLVRIQKALADAGVASRRAAETLVAEGRVSVNGQPAQIGQRVDTERDDIRVNGKPLPAPAARTYLVVAKPLGVTSTVADPHAERTVVELVPAELRRGARIYPVGRLDKDSEGLLLLTDDGDWAQRLLHPRHEIEREYAVGLDRPITDGERRQLLAGVTLAEGIARLDYLALASADQLRQLGRLLGPAAMGHRWYVVSIRQGWKRQLRRMFGALDVPVRRLVRLRIGNLELGDMRLGDVRRLTPGEMRRLSMIAGGG